MLEQMGPGVLPERIQTVQTRALRRDKGWNPLWPGRTVPLLDRGRGELV